MIKLRYLFLVVFSLFIAFSCSNPNRKYIKEISTLQHSVDEMQNELEKVDLVFFREKYTEVSKNMDFIQKNMNKINMQDTAVSKYIGAYGTLQKTMSRTFRKGASGLEGMLDECEKQLDNLKHDIKHDILKNEDMIETFVKSEKNEVERLQRKMKAISEQFSGHLKNYNKLSPRIEQIIKKVEEQ